MQTPNRFDYVRYDEISMNKQAEFKAAFIGLEQLVAQSLCKGRASALVLTKLEEAYMWVGKSIRDEQLEVRHNGELEEGRSES
jgi:hypothetical protein